MIMAEIHNSELIKGIREDAKIQTSIDDVPTQLGKTVVPVMETNPKLFRVCDVVASTAGFSSTTLYSVPTNKDFFLTNAWVQIDGTADQVSERIITIIINGVGVVLLRIKNNSAYASVGGGSPSPALALNFSVPIKIDRGTNIVVTGAQTLGYAGIVGYTVED